MDSMRDMMERASRKTGEKIIKSGVRPKPRDVVANAQKACEVVIQRLARTGNMTVIHSMRNPVQAMDLWGEIYDLRPCDVRIINEYCKRMGFEYVKPAIRH